MLSKCLVGFCKSLSDIYQSGCTVSHSHIQCIRTITAPGSTHGY